MKTIKFRARRLDNKEWVYGYYLYIEEQDKHYILTGKIKTYPVDSVHHHIVVEGFEWIEVDGKTVCEFTGVKDKNGVDIYEGDIVKYRRKFDDADYEVAQVVFDQGCCRFALWIGKYVKDVYKGRFLYLLNRPELHEVIGNIHQNKELLEK